MHILFQAFTQCVDIACYQALNRVAGRGKGRVICFFSPSPPLLRQPHRLRGYAEQSGKQRKEGQQQTMVPRERQPAQQAFPFGFGAKKDRFLPREKLNESQKMKGVGRGRGRKETPRYFTCTIFRAVFDSRSLFFAPKPTETLATQAKGESRNHLWKFIVLIAH